MRHSPSEQPDGLSGPRDSPLTIVESERIAELVVFINTTHCSKGMKVYRSHLVLRCASISQVCGSTFAAIQGLPTGKFLSQIISSQ
jgi:hypothetical protein